MKPLFILGATASGKTGAALEAALRRGGEIVGADSVQIYRGLVIGSAAPSEAEMALVPHHLIGTEELGNEINAGIYIKKAKAAISDIIGRGRLPIVVGGTNFYVDALLNGLSPVPEIDAVWDVLASCDIHGAADSSIKNAAPNDFTPLFEKSKIRHVFCTEKTAYNLWQKFCAAQYEQRFNLQSHCLPSTSPANAAWSIDRLIAEYQKNVLSYL